MLQEVDLPLVVNAVTKSGTNELEGDFYVYNRNEGMVGSDAFGNEPGNFAELLDLA